MQIVELPRLSNSHAALTAAYRAGLPLQERGWMRYPAASWDKPAIVAMDGDRCVAGINFSEDDDDLVLHLQFAFAEPSHPAAFAALLARFRSRYRAGHYTEIRFTCHEGNEAMARAVKLLGLTPVSHTYHLPVAQMDRRGGR